MLALDAALLAVGRLWMGRAGVGDIAAVSARRRRPAMAGALAGALAVAGVTAAAPPRRDVPLIGPATTALIALIALEPPPTPTDWLAGLEREPRIALQRGRRVQIDVVRLGDVELEVGTARAFLAMRDAASRAGVELVISSGFRSRADQARLWRAWRKRIGHRAARPGRSNHQSGRALDLVVLNVPAAGAWLEANARGFGFRRTVPNEPWHWEHEDAPRAAGPRAIAGRGEAAKAKAKAKAKRAKGKRRAIAKADVREPRAARGDGHRRRRAVR